MQPKDKAFWSAVATLVGAIVGVGVFGVPYAFSKAGWISAALCLFVLGGIQVLQHLFFAEAGIATQENLRFVGITEKYLGKRAKTVAAVSTLLGQWAGILAYIVVGGTFLHVLLSPFFGGTVFVYQLLWAAVGALVLYFDPTVITRIDVAATVILVATFLALVAMSAFHVQPANFVAFTGHDFFLPYGVVLFSLSGLPAVLELESIVKGDPVAYRRSVLVGTLAATALTAALGFVVWGVTGTNTTEAAVVGLGAQLGQGIAVLGAVCGFFAIATSFFATAMNLKETFILDYHHRHGFAWTLAALVPIAAFLLGVNRFVAVISFSGAVFGGTSAVLVALVYITIVKRRLVKDRPLGIPLHWAYASIVILTIGAVTEAATVAMHWLR